VETHAQQEIGNENLHLLQGIHPRRWHTISVDWVLPSISLSTLPSTLLSTLLSVLHVIFCTAFGFGYSLHRKVRFHQEDERHHIYLETLQRLRDTA
jgi:hypothetical protein